MYLIFEVYRFFFLEAGEAGKKSETRREKEEQETNHQL